jgi:hypothetical protein
MDSYKPKKWIDPNFLDKKMQTEDDSAVRSDNRTQFSMRPICAYLAWCGDGCPRNPFRLRIDAPPKCRNNRSRKICTGNACSHPHRRSPPLHPHTRSDVTLVGKKRLVTPRCNARKKRACNTFFRSKLKRFKNRFCSSLNKQTCHSWTDSRNTSSPSPQTVLSIGSAIPWSRKIAIFFLAHFAREKGKSNEKLILF